MTRKSFLFSALWALFMLLMAPAAHAGYNNCTSQQLPYAASIASNIPSSLAGGAVVNGSTLAMTIDINCPPSWSDSEGTNCYRSNNWALVPASGSIATTAVPNVYRQAGMPAGLGYQVLGAAGQPLPLDPNSRVNTGVRIQTGLQSIPLRVRVVKLDNSVTAGGFVLRWIVTCSQNENANGANSTIDLTINTKLLTQTCVMTVANVQVSLPQVATNKFSGVGSAAGGTPVPLSFQCDPNVDASINFTDASSPSNSSTALSLQAGSTATGVGVQMVSAGSPIKMSPNEDFNFGGTEIALKNPGSGVTVVPIPMTAQYVQTNASMTPGTVQARALVNIAYK